MIKATAPKILDTCIKLTLMSKGNLEIEFRPNLPQLFSVRNKNNLLSNVVYDFEAGHWTIQNNPYNTPLSQRELANLEAEIKFQVGTCQILNGFIKQLRKTK